MDYSLSLLKLFFPPEGLMSTEKTFQKNGWKVLRPNHVHAHQLNDLQVALVEDRIMNTLLGLHKNKCQTETAQPCY